MIHLDYVYSKECRCCASSEGETRAGLGGWVMVCGGVGVGWCW